MDRPRATLGRMQNPVRGFLHGAAAVVSVAGTALLLMRAANLSAQIAAIVFGLGLVGLYTVSSLYHAVPWAEVWKRRMQRADHSMVFVLVAGTFTPIAVILLDGWLRWATLAAVWGIAAAGISLVLFPKRAKTKASIALNTVLGWLGAFLVIPIIQTVGMSAAVILGIGGVAYTVGMVFMVTGRPRLWPRVFSSHELFHVLVIAGSFSHWLVTYRWVVPYTA